MADDENVDRNIPPEPKPSFEQMNRDADARLAEELKTGDFALAEVDEEPPAPDPDPTPAPVADPPPAAPAAPVKEPDEPAPAAAAPVDDEIPATDFTEVFAEFDGDPAKLAAALADARAKKPAEWKPGAPAAKPADAPPAAPAAAAPAADAPPAAPPKAFNVTEYLDGLAKKDDGERTDEERALVHGLGVVGSHRQNVENALKAVNDKRTELKGIDDKLAEEQVVHKRLTAKVAAKPDDFRAGEELEESTASLKDLRREREGLRLELTNLENDHGQSHATWKAHRDRLVNATTGIYQRDTQAVEATVNHKKRTDAALEEWNKEFPAFFKELNLGDVDADTRKKAEKLLSKLAFADLQTRAVSGLGDFENLRAWMNEHADVVTGLVTAGSREAVKKYVAQKKQDAQPRAPKGAAASAPAPEGGRAPKKGMTWEQANAASAELHDREFGVRT